MARMTRGGEARAGSWVSETLEKMLNQCTWHKVSSSPPSWGTPRGTKIDAALYNLNLRGTVSFLSLCRTQFFQVVGVLQEKWNFYLFLTWQMQNILPMSPFKTGLGYILGILTVTHPSIFAHQSHAASDCIAACARPWNSDTATTEDEMSCS